MVTTTFSVAEESPNMISDIIKVLIVDDHQVVRHGMNRILKADKNIQIVGEAANGNEAVSLCAKLRPDVVVMDHMMPGMNGVEAAREIKSKTPKTKVLMLTLYSDDVVKHALEAGVEGYLLKDSDGDQIITAVHQVHQGLFPLAPSVTRDMVTEFTKLKAAQRSSILTDREAQILTLVAQGLNGSAIGEKIFISPSTVKREIQHIFNKLGVNDRPHAVSEGIKRKIIQV
jgi:NarL family two-component system response regulator LiaR